MKKRILEVIVVCLFCILEAGAAYFFAQTQDSVKTRFGQEAQETVGESAGADGDSDAVEESFPVLVWSESVSCGGSSYQMRFDRISPLYDTAPDTAGMPSYHADYMLSLLDADGALVSEQVVADFPVRFEEVYWIRDFSGDGFVDIAFCTAYRSSNMMNIFYIWNTENARYEASSLPLKDHASMETGPLWNEELSCVITFHDTDWDTAMPVLEMYSFVDEEWQMVRRLEAIGIEGEYYMDHLEYSGERRELLYENGEVIGETIVESNYDAGTIWYRPDSVWSCYYEGNLCLYPDERYWERNETPVGGFPIEKYVRVHEDDAAYQREYDGWYDMLEDRRLPYVDAETFAFLRDAYADVDFSGEFERGDVDTYPRYLAAFYQLFCGDALLTDRETGETMLLSDFRFFEDFFLSEKDHYSFYFFDMDGDGAPELTVYQFAVGYVVLDYDAETDAFSIWYDAEACWYGLVGSRKMLWAWDGRYLAFYQLDENGDAACETFCGPMYYNGEEAVYLVMLPTYAKEEERLSVPDKIREQGRYSRSDEQWCFRVTGDQYGEITEAFWEAYESRYEQKDMETYTYEELFGALEAEACADRGQSNESTDDEVRAGEGSETLYFDAGSRSGAHFTAYRVPYDEVRADRKYKDGDYIAIKDLESGAIFYVPDEYGELVDIQVTETCACIRDRDWESGTLREHRIPEYFLFSKECVLNIRARRTYDTILVGTERAEDLPQRVWQEAFVYDGELFEVLFDRISPIYHEGFMESAYGYMADYCLTVRDGEGTVISKQRILGLPVYFERVHWMIDFSGDGFPDIALCSDLMYGSRFSFAQTYFLIWDAQKMAYEEKPLPVKNTGAYHTGFVYWVPELDAVWRDIGTDDYRGDIYGMFSFVDGEWQLVRRLEEIYSETETCEGPGENIEYPCMEAYRELYYQDGKMVREERREERWDGEQGKLYPAYREWMSGEAEIGGVTLSCYYVRNKE